MENVVVFSKKVLFKRLAADGLLFPGPCWLFSICGIGLAETSNIYKVYDGFGTGDNQLLTLACGSYDSDKRIYEYPIFFAKGCYVDFATNGEEITAQLLRVGE